MFVNYASVLHYISNLNPLQIYENILSKSNNNMNLKQVQYCFNKNWNSLY